MLIFFDDLLVGELGEKQYRLYLAAEAKSLGRGGTSKVANATGAARNTIAAGLKELEQKSSEQQITQPTEEVKQEKKVRQRRRGGRKPVAQDKRIRKIGGGRKRTTNLDATLKDDLNALLEPFEAGDPCSPLRQLGILKNDFHGEWNYTLNPVKIDQVIM